MLDSNGGVREVEGDEWEEGRETWGNVWKVYIKRYIN